MMRLFLILFIIVAAKNLYSWSSIPPTTFIPENGHGFFALTGSYFKTEEQIETGHRGEFEGQSGGAYIFHSRHANLAYGLGCDYMKGKGSQMVPNATTGVLESVDANVEVLAPTFFIVKTLYGRSRSNGIALTLGFSRMYFKLEGGQTYEINMLRAGLLAQYFLMRFLAIVPFVEFAYQGQAGAELVLFLRGFQLGIGSVISAFGKKDPEDKDTKYGATLKFSW